MAPASRNAKLVLPADDVVCSEIQMRGISPSQTRLSEAENEITLGVVTAASSVLPDWISSE